MANETINIRAERAKRSPLSYMFSWYLKESFLASIMFAFAAFVLVNSIINKTLDRNSLLFIGVAVICFLLMLYSAYRETRKKMYSFYVKEEQTPTGPKRSIVKVTISTGKNVPDDVTPFDYLTFVHAWKGKKYSDVEFRLVKRSEKNPRMFDYEKFRFKDVKDAQQFVDDILAKPKLFLSGNVPG